MRQAEYFVTDNGIQVQTFPDDFVFEHNHITHGYKMVGNAVPVKIAEILANQIKNTLFA